MKIDQYCQRQRCKHVELNWNNFWHAFASRGFVSDSWAFLLKQLKRAAIPTDQLLHFYVAVIRPVLEYCTPVCHYESTQKRAIRVIFPFTREITHTHCLLLISTPCIPDAMTFQSHTFKTFATHLPAFTTSSHPRATLLFYSGSEQSRLSHAYPSVLLHYIV